MKVKYIIIGGVILLCVIFTFALARMRAITEKRWEEIWNEKKKTDEASDGTGTR